MQYIHLKSIPTKRHHFTINPSSRHIRHFNYNINEYYVYWHIFIIYLYMCIDLQNQYSFIAYTYTMHILFWWQPCNMQFTLFHEHIQVVLLPVSGIFKSPSKAGVCSVTKHSWAFGAVYQISLHFILIFINFRSMRHSTKTQCRINLFLSP